MTFENETKALQHRMALDAIRGMFKQGKSVSSIVDEFPNMKADISNIYEEINKDDGSISDFLDIEEETPIVKAERIVAGIPSELIIYAEYLEVDPMCFTLSNIQGRLRTYAKSYPGKYSPSDIEALADRAWKNKLKAHRK